MASSYKVASGSGVALVSLNTITPQPRCSGLKATQRTYGASGKIHEMAPYAELVWDVLETESEYTTLLAAFGLTSALEASVTVYIRNSAYAYARYNALAVRPMIGQDGQWDSYFLRNFVILLKNLVAI